MRPTDLNGAGEAAPTNRDKLREYAAYIVANKKIAAPPNIRSNIFMYPSVIDEQTGQVLYDQLRVLAPSDISHFTAFFIVARAKRSIVKSFLF